MSDMVYPFYAYKIFKRGVRSMSQAELANVGKFILALFGYFIGTGVLGITISGEDSDAFPVVGWVIGGIMFAVLVLFM